MKNVSIESRLARFIVSHRDNRKQPTPLFDVSQKPLGKIQESKFHYLQDRKKKGMMMQKPHIANSISRGEKVIHEARILAGALQLTGKNRLPTVYEMAAIGFLKYKGVTPEFSQYLFKMSSVYNHYKSKYWWTGSPIPLMEAIRVIVPGTTTPLLTAVENALRESTTSLSTEEIATRIKLPLTKTNQTYLAVILNLLLASHMAKNQPNEVRKRPTGGTVLARWSHAGNKNPSIHDSNPGWNLLVRLRNGPIPLKGIDHRTISHLLENNLIQRTTRVIYNNRSDSTYELTPKTAADIEKYDRTGEFPERIRRVLSQRRKKMQKMKMTV